MKIKGTRSSITFDFENGYIVKGSGEILINHRFVVYISSLRHWEPPHEKERVTDEQIKMIICEVEKVTDDSTVKIIFENESCSPQGDCDM